MSAFVSLAFLLLVGIEAQGQYTRPTGDPPTDSDLLAYDGQQKTVVVQIVNATPYDILLKDASTNPPSSPPPPLTSSSVTASDETEMLDRTRTNTKSFMIAPVGIPQYIPGTPLVAFNNTDPTYRNKFTRPYTMVFAWDDDGGIRQDNWVKWTLKQVPYCTSGYADSNNQWICTKYSNGDADLGLWMYRIPQSPTKVDSVFLPELLQRFLSEALALIGVILEPENPLDWIHMMLATKELGTSLTEFQKENTEADIGNKLYLASYVIPADTSFCSKISNSGYADCSPALMTLRPSPTSPDPTGDAVASMWDSRAAGACPLPGGCTTIGQGPAFAPVSELVVTTHLLRSQTAPACPTSQPDYTNYTCPLGRLNNFMITIMRPQEFSVSALSGGSAGGTVSLGPAATGASQSVETEKRDFQAFLLKVGAGKIRSILRRKGLDGLLVLRSIVQNNLDFAQRQLLTQMIRDMLAGNSPTQAERDLVSFITTQLEAQLNSNEERRHEPCLRHEKDSCRQ
jgi:hypothetical protein